MDAVTLESHTLRTALSLLAAGVISSGAAACGGGGPPPPQNPRDDDARAGQAVPPGPQETTRAAPSVWWTKDALLRRLEGRHIRVERLSVVMDPETLTCSGEGTPRRRRGGDPAWARFRCVQPTFPAGGVAGPDLRFIVRPTGRRTYAVSNQRLSRY